MDNCNESESFILHQLNNFSNSDNVSRIGIMNLRTPLAHSTTLNRCNNVTNIIELKLNKTKNSSIPNEVENKPPFNAMTSNISNNFQMPHLTFNENCLNETDVSDVFQMKLSLKTFPVYMNSLKLDVLQLMNNSIYNPDIKVVKKSKNIIDIVKNIHKIMKSNESTFITPKLNQINHSAVSFLPVDLNSLNLLSSKLDYVSNILDYNKLALNKQILNDNSERLEVGQLKENLDVQNNSNFNDDIKLLEPNDVDVISSNIVETLDSFDQIRELNKSMTLPSPVDKSFFYHKSLSLQSLKNSLLYDLSNEKLSEIIIPRINLPLPYQESDVNVLQPVNKNHSNSSQTEICDNENQFKLSSKEVSDIITQQINLSGQEFVENSPQLVNKTYSTSSRIEETCADKNQNTSSGHESSPKMSIENSSSSKYNSRSTNISDTVSSDISEHYNNEPDKDESISANNSSFGHPFQATISDEHVDKNESRYSSSNHPEATLNSVSSISSIKRKSSCSRKLNSSDTFGHESSPKMSIENSSSSKYNSRSTNISDTVSSDISEHCNNEPDKDESISANNSSFSHPFQATISDEHVDKNESRHSSSNHPEATLNSVSSISSIKRKSSCSRKLNGSDTFSKKSKAFDEHITSIIDRETSSDVNEVYYSVCNGSKSYNDSSDGKMEFKSPLAFSSPLSKNKNITYVNQTYILPKESGINGSISTNENPVNNSRINIGDDNHLENNNQSRYSLRKYPKATEHYFAPVKSSNKKKSSSSITSEINSSSVECDVNALISTDENPVNNSQMNIGDDNHLDINNQSRYSLRKHPKATEHYFPPIKKLIKRKSCSSMSEINTSSVERDINKSIDEYRFNNSQLNICDDKQLDNNHNQYCLRKHPKATEHYFSPFNLTKKKLGRKSGRKSHHGDVFVCKGYGIKKIMVHYKVHSVLKADSRELMKKICPENKNSKFNNKQQNTTNFDFSNLKPSKNDKHCLCGIFPSQIPSSWSNSLHESIHKNLHKVQFKVQSSIDIISKINNNGFVYDIIKINENCNNDNKLKVVLKNIQDFINLEVNFSEKNISYSNRLIFLAVIPNSQVIGYLEIETLKKACVYENKRLSENLKAVKFGVSKLWVMVKYRNNGVATNLLKQFCDTEHLKTNDIAFAYCGSQNMPFIKNYFTKNSILIY